MHSIYEYNRKGTALHGQESYGKTALLKFGLPQMVSINFVKNLLEDMAGGKEVAGMVVMCCRSKASKYVFVDLLRVQQICWC